MRKKNRKSARVRYCDHSLLSDIFLSVVPQVFEHLLNHIAKKLHPNFKRNDSWIVHCQKYLKTCIPFKNLVSMVTKRKTLKILSEKIKAKILDVFSL